MFTADQIVAHLVGDYIVQSNWMATEKTKRTIAAAVHAVTYTMVFLFLTRSPLALAFICLTHFAIDRWRLARFVIWFKNMPWQPWADCAATGYHKDVPPWLAVWLLIICDNTLHLICNGIAIHYL